MRVICCFTALHPQAAEAIGRFAPQAEMVPTPGIYDYGEAIASRWDGSDDLVVIEGDKVITAGVLPSFASCDQPWCGYGSMSFPPPYTRWIAGGLGCARFSAAVQRRVRPDEFLGPDEPNWYTCRHCGGKGCWLYLDSRIGLCMQRLGISHHVHGSVGHLHEYPPGWRPYSDTIWFGM